MPDQAPNIDIQPSKGGRLVYDKARRTIVAEGVSVTVNAPHDLQALLATMKSAKAQGVHMAIWDRDIKTVEDAITTIEGIRRIGALPKGSENVR